MKGRNIITKLGTKSLRKEHNHKTKPLRLRKNPTKLGTKTTKLGSKPTKLGTKTTKLETKPTKLGKNLKSREHNLKIGT